MRIILSILLLLSIGFGITPIQHPFDVKNLHPNELNDFLPFEDEGSQIRLKRMSLNGWNLLRFDYQDWDGSEWVNDYRHTYTYDTNNNETEFLREDWDGSEWVNNFRNIYTFDTNNNETESINQDWDGSE